MLLNCRVGEDSWESLGLQGDPTSNPIGNQSWIFIRRTGAEAETPILWPPQAKSWLIGTDPDGGKDWKQEKREAKDAMDGWHHQLNGHEFEQTPWDSKGQGSLACCSPWGCKESDTTERLSNILSSDAKHIIWRRNGTPLQYSCLENPMDRGAW